MATKRFAKIVHSLALGVLPALFSLLKAQEAVANQVAAKKADVEVYAEANKSSSVVATLKEGESLKAKDRKGMFWQVQLKDGNVGYVSVMQVKSTGGGGDSNIANALREAVQKERNDDDAANMRSRSAVMGVRGLDDTSETAFAGNAKPNLRMVYSMESYTVKKEKVSELGRMVEDEIAHRVKKKERRED